MLFSLFKLVRRFFRAASNDAIDRDRKAAGVLGVVKIFKFWKKLPIDLTHHLGQNSHHPSVCLGVRHLNNCRNLSPPKDFTLLYLLLDPARELESWSNNWRPLGNHEPFWWGAAAARAAARRATRRTRFISSVWRLWSHKSSWSQYYFRWKRWWFYQSMPRVFWATAAAAAAAAAAGGMWSTWSRMWLWLFNLRWLSWLRPRR